MPITNYELQFFSVIFLVCNPESLWVVPLVFCLEFIIVICKWRFVRRLLKQVNWEPALNSTHDFIYWFYAQNSLINISSQDPSRLKYLIACSTIQSATW